MFEGEKITIHNGDCIEILKTIPDGSADMVLTDPPYLLVRAHWDAPFDHEAVWREAWRILKPAGFLAVFGRGDSLYEWAVAMKKQGFNFLEEIVWDKQQITSPVNKISRTHELCLIYGKPEAHIINSKVTIDQEEFPDFRRMSGQLDRIESILNKGIDHPRVAALRQFLKDGVKIYNRLRKSRYNLTVRKAILKPDDEITAMNSLLNGFNERTVMQVNHEHFDRIHGTQKPVYLLQRIMNVCIPPNTDKLIIDPFSGSASTGIAARLNGHRSVLIEKDENHYNLSVKRVQEEILQRELFI